MPSDWEATTIEICRDTDPRAGAYGRATAILLAGGRRGDLLALRANAPAKSLVRVAGRAMVEHVLDALVESGKFCRIKIFAQNSARIESHLAERTYGSVEVSFHQSREGIAETIAPLVAEAEGPLLVTTSDHVLLDSAILDAFMREAAGADLAVGMVERETLLAAYPSSKRTWLRFRGGAYSGANLFWIGSARATPLVDLWRGVERDRKRGWKVIGAFGPFALAGAALGLLTLEHAFAHVSRRFGLDARAVLLDQPEACIDVDTVSDLRLAEQILFDRHAAAEAVVSRAAE